jgi:hypothetical protein
MARGGPTASVVFVLGAGVALLGDACQVVSGTTSYLEHATPRLLIGPVLERAVEAQGRLPT